MEENHRLRRAQPSGTPSLVRAWLSKPDGPVPSREEMDRRLGGRHLDIEGDIRKMRERPPASDDSD